VHEASRRVLGSTTTQDCPKARASAPGHVAFRTTLSRRRPDCVFSKLNAQPTYSPVYASLCTSRCPVQDSGPSGSLILSRKALSSSASCRLFRKHLPADCVGRGGLGTQPDLHRETETPKASQVMVSTTFPPPLFGCVFSAKKWHTSFQHAVKNDQHMMSHRDNRAFLATPWC
jgi:hypothetical protein